MLCNLVLATRNAWAMVSFMTQGSLRDADFGIKSWPARFPIRLRQSHSRGLSTSWYSASVLLAKMVSFRAAPMRLLPSKLDLQIQMIRSSFLSLLKERLKSPPYPRPWSVLRDGWMRTNKAQMRRFQYHTILVCLILRIPIPFQHLALAELSSDSF